MAHDVFVSYSSKDKPVADAVVAGLEQREVRCWFAPRDVTPGTSWGDAIINAIEGSRIMVVLLSGNSNDSRQVVREVERAVAKGVIIIPFRIEKIDPTGAMAYFLSSEHWLDALTPPMEEHIEKLGTTVQLFLSENVRPGAGARFTKAAASPVAAAPRWKAAWIGALLLGVGIIATLAVILIPRLMNNTPTSSPLAPTQTEALAETATPTQTEIPATPTPLPLPEFSVLGEYRTSGSAYSLFIENNTLALANGVNGVLMLDISDPANPTLGDTYEFADLPAQRLVIDGETAYVIVGEDVRELVIQSLGTARASTTFPAEGQRLFSGLYNVAVNDGFAHLTSHNYWSILDVSDPLNPIEIWTWEPPEHSGNPCNAEIQGNIAYIGCGWAGLYTFDISDPASPELLGQFNTPDWIIDLAISGQVLYLSLGDSGVLSLDISDPAMPLFMDRIDLPGFTTRLSGSGDTLYAIYLAYDEYVVEESGVVALDVKNPEQLEIITTYTELNNGSDIQVVEDAIYVTDEARGLIILSLGVR